MGHLTNENTLALYCIEKTWVWISLYILYILIRTFVFHLFSILESILDTHGLV